MVRRRFLSVERKLQRDDKLRKTYVQFMYEYLAMGHMEKLLETYRLVLSLMALLQRHSWLRNV